MREHLHFSTRSREFVRYSERTIRRMLDRSRTRPYFASRGTTSLILRAFRVEDRQDRRHYLHRALLGAGLINLAEYVEAEKAWVGSSSEDSDKTLDSDETFEDSDEDMATDHVVCLPHIAQPIRASVEC